MDSPTTDNEGGGGSEGAEKFVLAVDIGTTSLRSHIYNKQGNIKGASSKRVSAGGWLKREEGLIQERAGAYFKGLPDGSYSLPSAKITHSWFLCNHVINDSNIL
jgi:hypothetical protein